MLCTTGRSQNEQLVKIVVSMRCVPKTLQPFLELMWGCPNLQLRCWGPWHHLRKWTPGLRSSSRRSERSLRCWWQNWWRWSTWKRRTRRSCSRRPHPRHRRPRRRCFPVHAGPAMRNERTLIQLLCSQDFWNSMMKTPAKQIFPTVT